ncbi:TonB-dependent receptor [Parasphingorhabdus sp.]|uniref:TonB-dependent receptor n=1 Tax=Parasphingorhabdus sp. TaxID=2709688 RepID=UPI003001EF46
MLWGSKSSNFVNGRTARASAIRTAGMSTALVAMLWSGAAWSQEQADDVDEAGARNSGIIIVTAQKREQTLVDVPQSISVVSGDALEAQQASSFQDYLNLVPGLQLVQDTPGFGRLVIRGVNTGGVASTVATYVDETPFGSSSGLVNGAILAGDFDTFDVARVEVLRGPQGTLYGASSLGGVVKFVTNEPDTTQFVGRVRGSVETVKGGDISYAGNAVINVPLGDTLAFRASGTYRKQGGFIDSIGSTSTDLFGSTFTSRQAENINGTKSYGGRASLKFTPDDALSVRLSAIFQNFEADAPSSVESDPDTLETLFGRPTQSLFVSPASDVSYRVYNGVIDYDFGFATLTSSSSYATLEQQFRDDLSFNLSTALGLFPDQIYLNQTTRAKKFTQEVRLASSESSFIDWIIGGYYTKENGLIDQEFIPVTQGTLNRITALGTLAIATLDSEYEEIAGFANATVHLGDRFDIDLGGRYSHNNQNALQGTDGPLAGGLTSASQNSSENVFTYSVAPKFKFGDNASVYARVAKGFRPGGPNALAPGAPASVQTFDSDTVLSYELGVKAATLDNSFSIEAAVYHIDWSNVQLIAAIGNFNVNTNGPGAESDGLEFTATARPTPGLVLSVNGAYTDARLTDDTVVVTNGVPGANLVGGIKGDALPFTPKYSISVNGDYEWSLSDSVTASFGGSLRFLSKQSGAFDGAYRTANGRQRELPSYEVIDLRAGLDFGQFRVEGFVRNLTNSDGKTSIASLNSNGLPVLPNGAIGTGIIRPRSIGLALTAEY